MSKKLIYFVLVLSFCLASSLQAATIIWVSDNKGNDATDQGWIDLLVAKGYTVDLSFRNQEGRTLDAAKIDALNAADLIIVSRDTGSGSYDDGEEPTQWNSITTPLILQAAHIYRSSRWLWMNSTSTSSTTANLLAVLPDHPIFTGVTLDGSNQVNILTAQSNVGDNNVDPTNNYTLIATRSDSGADGVWIAEWEPGVEFYPGAGQFAGGHRMYFATGGAEGSDIDGRYNLTAEGEKLFLNAVRYMLGETGGPGQASNPKPANEATDVPRDAVLSWTPGEFAPPVNGHKVYLSESFNDVNDGIGGITQDANSYARPQRLDFGTTYYWRIDEVNAPPDSTVFEGNVWSFTTEPVGYPIENITATASSTSQEGMGPENTINGLGLDVNDLHSTEAMDMWLSSDEPNGVWIEYELDKVYKLHEMWVWNSNGMLESVLGFGLKDVTIEYSTNGTDYTTLGTTHEFARAPGTPDYAHNTTVDLSGVTAKYVRLTTNSNWGNILDQYGLSEVRFFSIPVFAREPSPDSGTTDVAVDVTLGFRAGREAAQHDVYLSSDEQAVIDGNAPVTTVTETSYGPLSLDLGTTYYWKINEVNEAETPTTWQGDIWNFTTHEFFVVDDFEDYNDYPPDEIWATWVDGYGVPANGATAGYPAPDFLAGEHYVETTIVHGGDQAMPFFYDNTGAAAYSEGERTFAVPQNWTEAGVQTLVLYFHGTIGNTGQLYVKVNGSKVVYDGDTADIAKPRWKQWNIDLASLGMDLQNVTTLAIGIDGSGASGTLYFDDIRLYRSVSEPAEEIWLEAELADIIGASWRIYDDPASSGGRHIGSEDGDGNDNDTAPGAEWLAVYNFDAAGGTYKILLRAQEFGSDSFWVRITGATSQTHEDPDQPGTGWVRFNGIDAPDGWAWDEVHSDDHNQAIVNWTLPAGAHTIEIGKREEGVLLDAILITDDVD
ncbi:MAG: discoidin domain-containing protein [Planctomycetes bacterium]|nr:discoidin domain-containing protein [Planctomycetota bacterium]